MRPRHQNRRQAVDLLRRRPVLSVPEQAGEQAGRARTDVVAGRIDGLRELLRLVDRGLLSEAEFERQQRRLFRS
ncbi:hypothetical protein [Marmoricola sp. RAF53]|uniref:hypothetical protein n=1 Tax=Marmoricola sp. RAF53 TaxID=3233059 RepID=UPI003F95D350